MSRNCRANTSVLARTPPASSRDMSSKASSKPLMASDVASMRFSNSSRSAAVCSCFSAATSKLSACIGWRKSWLAAARNLVLAELARSAVSRCSRSAAVAFSIRSSSPWRDCSSCSAIPLRSFARRSNMAILTGPRRTPVAPAPMLCAACATSLMRRSRRWLNRCAMKPTLASTPASKDETVRPNRSISPRTLSKETSTIA